MPKGMLVLLVSTLLVCSLLGQHAEARPVQIDYGVIRRDTIVGCSKRHPANCKLPRANPWRRGCEDETRCRH
ncbi:hypothetical protein JHK82_055578 [Glycine max]|nr:hypothetical protein JHK82_055578 [Glycine max]